MAPSENYGDSERQRQNEQRGCVEGGSVGGGKNPKVRDAALRIVEVPTLALPDALLADPRRILPAAEAVFAAAEREGAPRDVLVAFTGHGSEFSGWRHQASRIRCTGPSAAGRLAGPERQV